MGTSRKTGIRRAVASARRCLRRNTRPPGGIHFGDLRHLDPVSADWGFDRGLPVDRYYIEAFLQRHAEDIHGRVLEVANNTYTTRFGGDRVTRSDILTDQPGSPVATLVADLAAGDNLPGDAFDCVICTQTLHFIFELKAAIATLRRILKPGGVLLATLPGISQISPEDMERSGDYWRVTNAAARRLFNEHFADSQLEITACGNVLTAISLLEGIAMQELNRSELDYVDEKYQVLITVRAVRQGDA